MATERPAIQRDWLVPSLAAWEPEAWPVAPDWRPVVDAFFSGATGKQLGRRVQQRLAAGAIIYPPQPLRALELTSLSAVRVVILGQDPYHGPGQSHGLAFSVARGVPAPPSLRNIQAELSRERHAGELAGGTHAPSDTDLTPWARQGVLLLNTSLTVEDATPAAHARWGWGVLTRAILAAVQRKPGPVVYMLWGKHAQDCTPAHEAAPDGAPRLYLRCNHPSPLSARRGPQPFLGCGHFAQANDFLTRLGMVPLDW